MWLFYACVLRTFSRQLLLLWFWHTPGCALNLKPPACCASPSPAGNEPAALVNAVLGNIIGIFITPLWLSHFLSVQGAAPYGAVLIELTYTIIGPLIVGQLMQFFTPKLVRQG